MSDTFRAVVVDKDEDGVVRTIVGERSTDELADDGVTIAVEYSSVNFKDALASRADGKVARRHPLIPGIDLAGRVVATDGSVPVGAEVVVHGYDLGVSHHGGFAELARAPAAWLVPLPTGLSTRQAMAIGTAGFTAAMSVMALQERGIEPADGPILVTGASGGVGSISIDLLTGCGYEVVASTGSTEAAPLLRALGAHEVIDRSTTSGVTERPLESERWAGAIDCVGGTTLPYILRTLRYGACVAASGNTGGSELLASVLPFILRGVALIGIDSVQVEPTRRREIWTRLATDLRPRHLDMLTTEIELDEVPHALEAIFEGRVNGRTVVRVADPQGVTR